MGLMELELARLEHRQRTEDAERRNGFQQLRRERLPARDRQRERPAALRSAVKLDWPVITLRLGPFQLALFRTVHLPQRGPATDSHGTSSFFPG
ncbi:hypothetical protein [Arthrobacter sp. YD2]|uniref:hypothetical protein n=1 Tax=Arthrobacter sp. YD2 TaxID=3058046 RepID=UPI0025B493D7|nr:hypothetical protein [Arthrobacter sp. YD2]MDN3905618.1 hypothetical protein [Arthrobacter sp. YD2]